MNQIRTLSGPISTPSEIEQTARALAVLREQFLTGDAQNSVQPRAFILRSWERCRAMDVDADKRLGQMAINSDDGLKDLREQNARLLRAALPVAKHLAEQLSDSGYAVILSDASGCVLEVLGDPGMQGRLAKIALLPGAIWTEDVAGTNAIGTVLSDRRSVQMMGGEHFCDGWTSTTCTASPIRHPLTAEVIGVLDISARYDLIRSHLPGMVAVAALEIGEQLRLLLPVSQLEPDGQAERVSATVLVEGFEPAGESPDDAMLAASGAIGASLDFSVTVEHITEQIARVLRLGGAAVCVFDDAGAPKEVSRWPRSAEPPSYLLSVLQGARSVSMLRERGEPLVVDDVSRSSLLPEALAVSLRAQSIALLPMAAARGIIGFVAASYPGAHHWTVAELKYGLALAAQAGTALENARLFGALQEQNRHVTTLNAVLQLLGALSDPSAHLNSVLDLIAEQMRVDAGLIFLRRKASSPMALVEHFGMPEHIIDHAREAENAHLPGIGGRVEATGVPVLVRAEDDSRVQNDPLVESGCDYVIAAPLEDAGEIFGVIALGAGRSRKLTRSDLETITAIGQQVGMALLKARLARSANEIEALRKADRLKSEFLATVSHDLRTPLTAIGASAERLLDPRGHKLAGDREAMAMLENVLHQSHRLGRLVDELLDLSQIQNGHLPLDCEWNELSEVIMDAIAPFPASRVVYEAPNDPPLLFVDRDRIIQVISNLVDNACKYSPSESEVAINATWTERELRICVSDRGPGVPRSEHENIFVPFYRVKTQMESRRSTGLGLAICRGIVQAHGGAIWIEERPGGGSTFLFTLPLVTEEALQQP